MYNLEEIITDHELVSDELSKLNLSESLEPFIVVVDQENKRSVKEILQEAHAEVAEIQTSRKRHHVDFDDTLSQKPSEDRHEFKPEGP
ncbi:hypothetical protein OnM2_071043 [Erysiphe neolycopersici]|uniref:Uncharacterized protein n=1 Tax=Erysiphe neolycopersici TaxID=212602 RepID=A0A420HKA9_9PEZI|nr:hypothetical protein OnM2_071043 [Erysiphe neolycopersici]